MNLDQLTDLGPQLKLEDLVAYERQIGCALPNDYREFLLATNGGNPKDAGYFIVKHALRKPESWVKIEFFYGLRRDDGLTLSQAREIHHGSLPDNVLPVAYDGFGNQIYVHLEDDFGAVFFWSHDVDVEDEKMASSFTEFFDNLK